MRPTKGTDPGRGRARSGHEGGETEEEEPRGAHGQAQRRGFLLAQREHVEGTAQGHRAAATPVSTKAAAACTWVQPRPSSPPASQKSTVLTRNSSVATSSTEVPAPARAETAMPVSSRPARPVRPEAPAMR